MIKHKFTGKQRQNLEFTDNPNEKYPSTFKIFPIGESFEKFVFSLFNENNGANDFTLSKLDTEILVNHLFKYLTKL